MIELSQVDRKFLKLYESQITIKQFESWVYDNKKLINTEKPNELYEELITLNYNTNEVKYELKKLLSINFEQLFKYKHQVTIAKILESDNLEINNVKYQMLYDLKNISFSFKINEIDFLMNSPFTIKNITQLSDKDKEDSFKEKFNDVKRFLKSILIAMETKEIRIWEAELTEFMDPITKTEFINTKEDEYKLLINGKMIFIKKKYINERMKKAWL